MSTKTAWKPVLSKVRQEAEEILYDDEALDVCPREEKDCDNCDILSCPEEK